MNCTYPKQGGNWDPPRERLALNVELGVPVVSLRLGAEALLRSQLHPVLGQ